MNTLLKGKNYLFYKVLKLNKKNIDDVKIIDEYIGHFPEPENTFERSYYQYLCQKKQYSESKVYSVLYNSMNFFSMICIMFLMLIPGKLYKKIFCINYIETDAVAAFNKVLDDRIPKEIKNEYKIDYMDKRGILLTKQEKNMILSLWKKYPFSFNFLLKCLIKIGMFKYIIDCSNQHIKAIVSSCEYSYTSSVLTQYCRDNSIKHINIMHGEMITELTRTFFEFDRFYVWDEYYIHLLVNKMRASKQQFYVTSPEFLLLDAEDSKKNKIEYKYYLQDQNEKQLFLIKGLLEKLSQSFMVRPHPLYTDVDAVKCVFDKTQIEDTSVSIKESIMDTMFLISRDSTVLFQGYINGKETIIDNITDIRRYNYFVEGGYIMIDKSKKLSEIL